MAQSCLKAAPAQPVQDRAHGGNGLAQVPAGVQPQRGHLDQYRCQAVRDHAVQQRCLRLMPQIRQRHQAQPRAHLRAAHSIDNLHMITLVTGHAGQQRHLRLTS